MDETRKKIDELYLMSGYMDKYGKDVWVSFILCIVFITLICYYALANVLEVVKLEWPYQKCNPLFMPFAGYINKPADQSNLEYTTGNFNECINSILYYAAVLAFQPFQIIITMVSESIQALLDAVNTMRKTFETLRKNCERLFAQIYAGMSNLMVAFIEFVVKTKDTMAKVNGVLTSSLFTMIGSYMAMESLFLSILDAVTMILIIIACIITVFIIVAIVLFAVPVFGPAWAVAPTVSAITTAVIMLAILIPLIWFEVMLLDVINLSTAPPPQVPSCFAGESVIPLFEPGTEKFIKDIRLGDQLKNGGKVCAIMKFAAAGQTVYRLNGVLVTGEHRVFHPALKWIKVKNHPDARVVPDFSEPYVYCLNTAAKEFLVGATLFSDWDDIDLTVLRALQQNCVVPGYLPANFTYADIHTYLASGFHPETTVKLKSGEVRPLRAVCVNDVLEDNTKVLGVIQMSGGTTYKHSFAQDQFLCGSKNIHIADASLGIINCMQKQSEKSETTPILYHLLTDTMFFQANGIRVNDYNYGIDAYLC